MHSLNHFIFSFSLCLLLLEPNLQNVFWAAIFSLVFSVLIDLDHWYKKIKRPWFARRTWIQEPPALFLIALPIALLLRFLNPSFFYLTLASFSSHILLDYLCVFKARPLAPFSKLEKPEGFGIFVPATHKWRRRIKGKISENYFLIFNLIFLLATLYFKLG